jgi:3-mercaptopyruvate sulfurtransferase SseA
VKMSSSNAVSQILKTALVTPKEVLLALKNAPPDDSNGRIKLVDASWHLPTPGAPKRDPLAEFQEKRCSGAVFFDIDAVCDKTSSLPHMLPSAEIFSEACSTKGISRDDTVVVYTTAGSFSAPRVWWTFRCFGHNKVITGPHFVGWLLNCFQSISTRK